MADVCSGFARIVKLRRAIGEIIIIQLPLVRPATHTVPVQFDEIPQPLVAPPSFYQHTQHIQHDTMFLLLLLLLLLLPSTSFILPGTPPSITRIHARPPKIPPLYPKIDLPTYLPLLSPLSPVRFCLTTPACILESHGTFRNIRWSDTLKAGRLATFSADDEEVNQVSVSFYESEIAEIKLLKMESPSTGKAVRILRFVNFGGECVLSAIVRTKEGGKEFDDLKESYGESVAFTRIKGSPPLFF